MLFGPDNEHVEEETRSKRYKLTTRLNRPSPSVSHLYVVLSCLPTLPGLSGRRISRVRHCLASSNTSFRPREMRRRTENKMSGLYMIIIAQRNNGYKLCLRKPCSSLSKFCYNVLDDNNLNIYACYYHHFRGQMIKRYGEGRK